jgi:hypothetical protein
MTVKLTFRGPCLYLNHEDVAEMVLLPDGQRELFDDNRKPGNHPDGTPTAEHFAGLAIFEGSDHETLVQRVELRGKLVTVGTGDTPCKTDPSYRDIVPIDEVANAGHTQPMTLIPETDPSFTDRVATKVILKGGTLGSDVVSTATFRMPTSLREFATRRRIPLSATWSLGANTTTIVVADREGSNPQTFELKDSQRAVIYNWDAFNPTAAELLRPAPTAEGIHEKEDTDFKWLYELFLPPAKTYMEWLGETGDQALRVPLTRAVEVVDKKGPRPPNAGSTSCDSARATIRRP